ncbi:hypothetical protein B0T14DRAFT_589302 [Immersiella caudata]|uniref:Uncharacterized protein n=1 Tax=Immersiella caudata TaxID=314043 RepID=A0AA40BX98_9PEZI|nr:hypothetical protein B0T14DRAFT_589302 [Immersiella caudata]
MVKQRSPALRNALVVSLAGHAAFPVDAAANLAIRRDAVTAMSTVHEVDTVTAWASSSPSKSTSIADKESQSNSTVTVTSSSGAVTSTITVRKDAQATVTVPQNSTSPTTKTLINPASVIACNCETKTLDQVSWTTVTSFVTITASCDTISTHQPKSNKTAPPIAPSIPPIEIHPTVTPFLPSDGESTLATPTISSSEDSSTIASKTSSPADSDSSTGEIPTTSTFPIMTNNTTSTTSPESAAPSIISITITATITNTKTANISDILPSPPSASPSSSSVSHLPPSPPIPSSTIITDTATESTADEGRHATQTTSCYTPTISGVPQPSLAMCHIDPVTADPSTITTTVLSITTTPTMNIGAGGTHPPLGPGHEIPNTVAGDFREREGLAV